VGEQYGDMRKGRLKKHDSCHAERNEESLFFEHSYLRKGFLATLGMTIPQMLYKRA